MGCLQQRMTLSFKSSCVGWYRILLGLTSEAPVDELLEGLQKLLRDYFPR